MSSPNRAAGIIISSGHSQPEYLITSFPVCKGKFSCFSRKIATFLLRLIVVSRLTPHQLQRIVIARSHPRRGGDVAISWYHLHHCIILPEVVPGDSHGPDGPRNDMEVGNWAHRRYCCKLQFTAVAASFQRHRVGSGPSIPPGNQISVPGGGTCGIPA